MWYSPRTRFRWKVQRKLAVHCIYILCTCLVGWSRTGWPHSVATTTARAWTTKDGVSYGSRYFTSFFVSTLADEYHQCVPVISWNQGWAHYHPLAAFWHFPCIIFFVQCNQKNGGPRRWLQKLLVETSCWIRKVSLSWSFFCCNWASSASSYSNQPFINHLLLEGLHNSVCCSINS